MLIQKRWTFGLSTIFSLIVVYLIYLYSKDKDWTLLAFISKWYLIIVGGLIALSVGMILLVILFSLLMFLIAMLKLHGFGKTRENQRFSAPRKFFKKFSREYKKPKSKDYVDIEYRVKE